VSAAHTPGPWRAGKGGGSVVADAAIADGIGGSDDVEFYGGHLIGESISKCNVSLIAAAPELLACAKDFEEVLQELGLACECGAADCRTTKLRAAIAKATGSAGHG
jgi:hypothetical protein